MIGLSSSTGSPRVDLVIDFIVDPNRAQRLAQRLFAGSTGIVVASSTGAAS
jgi:hypothetical protein